MNIECPCCGDCFEPNEDHHPGWPYFEDINLNDSGKIVWKKIPLLKSLWSSNDDENNPSPTQNRKKSAGKKQ